MKRRDFLSIAAGTTAGVSAMSFFPFQMANAKGMKSKGANTELLDIDSSGWGACPVDCGCRCPIHVNVKDGRIKYVETDNTTDDKILGTTNQIRACVRGRSTKFRVYNPLRLKKPLKRVGKRGDGKYLEISWDEAFDMMAKEFKRIGEKYGGESFYLSYGTGVLGGVLSASWHPSQSPFARLLNMYKGFTPFYNDYSVAHMEENGALMMGGWVSPSSVEQIKETDLLVSFGESFSENSLSGGSNNWYITKFLEEGGADFMLVDPRYSDTAVGKAKTWVPIRPGTDAAYIAGMLYTMHKEELLDQAFLDKYTMGWDEKSLPSGAPRNSSYMAYIDGSGYDKVAKTPDWAANVCGIPADDIIAHARRIAKAKSVYFCQGWGPQRNSNGDELSRAIYLLSVATGNIGKAGTSPGARTYSDGAYPVARFPVGTNPVKQKISFYMWLRAISDEWKTMTDTNAGVRGAKKLKAPIKCMITYAGNPVNQHANINKTVEVLKDESKCEFIVDINVVKSVSSNYADLILPDATTFEQVDLMRAYASGSMVYVILGGGAIKPIHETKSSYDICAGLAERMGFGDQYTEGKSQEDWVKEMWKQTQAAAEKAGYKPPKSYEEMLKKGVHKERAKAAGQIQFEKFIQDPVTNKVGTPSGKIEIYSQRAVEMNKKFTYKRGDSVRPIPMHVERFGSYKPHSREMKKYPLQMISFKSKAHVHSTYFENDVIRELHPQYLWINPVDAYERNIENYDMVQVATKFGKIEVQAWVTPRIMPGTIATKEGAWYKPAHDGVCHGPAVNVLTSDEPTPLGRSNGQKSNLAQVRKVSAKHTHKGRRPHSHSA